MTYFPPLVPGAAPLAVRGRNDILAQLPESVLRSDVRPVTDALADALLAILLECQYRGSYAAAQSDIARAVGRYIAELGAERHFAQAPGESAADYRARILEVEKGASLGAVRAAVNAILAPHTSSTCQVIEPALDRFFVGAAATVSSRSWHGCVGSGISPSYPDRLYPSESDRNGGESIAYSEPLGARTFSDRSGRLFMVLVPDLVGLTTEAHVLDYQSLTLPRPDWGFFVSSYTGTPVTVTDGDMEAAGTAAWTAYQATLSKQTGSPSGSGSQVLRAVATAADAKCWASQTLAVTTSQQLKVRGVFRSQDGIGVPAVSIGLSGGLYAGGLPSTDWQPFEAVGTPASDTIYLRNLAAISGSAVEFDEIEVDLLPGIDRRTFVRSESATALAVYRAIEDAVDAIAGHSMRWILMTSEHL